MTGHRRFPVGAKGCLAVMVAPLALGIGIAVNRALSASNLLQAAFTVEYTEVSTSPASGRILQQERYHAFRGDGAVSYGVRSLRSPRRTIISSRERREAVVSDTLGMKTTYDLSQELSGNEKRRVPSEHCAAPPRSEYRLVGNELVLGFNTYVYEAPPVTSPDGVTEEKKHWLAPDLLCFDLKTVAIRRNKKGEITGAFEKSAVQVLPGEPDSRLFAVPATFREVRPSEFERSSFVAHITARDGQERAKLLSQTESPEWRAQLARMDARYDALNKR